MVLRILVCVAISIFSIIQGFQSASILAINGRYYFPGIYIWVVVLLFSGFNKFGLITWPLASALLLLKGHFVVGWIPVALVIFNIIGNKIVDKK